MSATFEKIKCKNCGGILTYVPGTHFLKCEYCGTLNEIELNFQSISDFKTDFEQYGQLPDNQSHIETQVINCPACGAEFTVSKETIFDKCPFCGAQFSRQPENKKLLKPQAIVPFNIDKNQALEAFKIWLKNKIFFGKKLKKFAKVTEIRGIYLPFWVFDVQTSISYRTFTGTGGKMNFFSENIPYPAFKNQFLDYALKFFSWSVDEVVPFDEKFLLGYSAQTFKIDHKQAFEKIKKLALEDTETKFFRAFKKQFTKYNKEFSVKTKKVEIERVKFTLVLLPIWIASYRYKDDYFWFLINGQTGEIKGDYPLNKKLFKFALFTLLAVVSALLAYNFYLFVSFLTF